MDNNYGQYGGQMPNVPPISPPYYCPPDYVSPEEKKHLRRNYNSIGAALLIDYILGMAIAVTAMLTLQQFGYQTAYDENETMIAGLAEMIIGTWTLAIAGIIVFAGHCLITRYNPRELFRTNGIAPGEVVKYIFLILGLQKVAMICALFISMFLNSLGLEVTAFDYITAHDPQTYIADFIGAVILAPIGEELIFRGIVLRCSAKVSGRFAIFFSAFMFGLMHRNPYQFVLGFLIGIPLAMITLKTGSLIPAIICHMANNLFAEIISISEYFDENMSYVLSLISIPIFLVIGVIVLVNMFLKGEIKFPPYTERHKKRTLPIVITSWSIIAITVLYIIETITNLGPVDESVQESITEAARMLLK